MRDNNPGVEAERTSQFTMQQAVLTHFPNIDAVYNFTHRDPNVYFTRECYELFVESVKSMSYVRLPRIVRFPWIADSNLRNIFQSLESFVSL